MRHRWLVCALALCAAVPLDAGRPKTDRLPPSTALRLSNGMEVILIPNRAAALITSVVVVRAGLAYETPETNGVSHMLEHLLFNGTQKRTQEALYDEQDRYGIINNATTGPAHTAFFVMATRAQFHRALDLQADMLFGSTIPEDKLAKERGIIVNEIAKDRASDATFLEELYASGMHRGTPLAMPVIGTPETVNAISREAILAYYHARYVPNNMTAILMGDFEPTEIEPLVRRCFGGAAPGLIAATPAWETVTTAGGRTWSRRAPGTSRLLALGAPAPGPASPDLGPVWMVASLLSEELTAAVNGRLEAAGAAGRIVSAQVDYDPRGTAATLKAEASLDGALPYADAARALSAEISERARTATSAGRPWKSETLARLRLEEKSSLMRLWEKPHYFGLDRAPVIAVAGWEKARDLPRYLEFVEPADVRDAARKYASPSSWATFTTGADAADAPPEPLAAPLPAQTPTPESHDAVASWKGASKAAAVQSSAEPAPLTARAATTSDATSARLILDNGLLVSIDFTNDSRVFAAHVLVKNRASSEPPGKAGIADLLHRVAGSGTRRHPGHALEQALREIGGTLKVTDDASIPYDDIYLSPEYSYMRLEALDENAPEALGLLAEILSEPDFSSSDTLASARSQLAARAKQSAASASEQARRELARGLWGDAHPFARGLFGTEATVASINQEDLVAFHRSYFNPRNIILGIGTSVTPEQFLPALQAKLGHWSTTARPPRRPGAPEPAAADFSVRRASVTSSQAYLALGRLAPVDRGTDAAWTALAAVLSRRMGDVLREQRGLSYSLGAEAALLGGQRQITATMGTLPGKVSEAESGLKEVLLSLVSRPPEQTEIDDARRATEVRLLMRSLSRINRAWSRCLSELRGTAQPLGSVTAEPVADDLRSLTAALLADTRLPGWVEAIAAAPAQEPEQK